MIWLDLARVAIVVVLGFIAVWLGAPIVTRVFALVDRSARAVAPHSKGAEAAAAEPGPQLVAAAVHLRGGTWVGRLERTAIYVALIFRWPEGIAVALAIKGLARYPELKATNTGAAERFIIGTFTSVLAAAAAAGLARWLIGLF